MFTTFTTFVQVEFNRAIQEELVDNDFGEGEVTVFQNI